MNDLSGLAELTGLEFLKLYGLKRVASVPSLVAHRSLKRIDVGRMLGLIGLGGLLDARALEELLVIGKTHNCVARC